MLVLNIESNADYFSLLSFRRSCKVNNEKGMVTEGKYIFIVNEQGNYEGNEYPQIEHNIWQMTAKLAKGE